MRRVADDLDRKFWDRVVKSVQGCWLWTGPLQRDEYGVIYWEGRSQAAHRFAYQLLVGPIPAGLLLDHLCRVHRCVNPAHLEPVTSRENTMRSLIAPAAVNARKTHCARGHEFSDVNTYVLASGQRVCRECSLAGSARQAARLGRTPASQRTLEHRAKIAAGVRRYHTQRSRVA